MIFGPLVSVITPVYNREKYLVECIESVLNQTYKNFEFIIIDDKSSDNTLQIIKNYALNDPRIRVLENDKNIGATLSFNRGLDISKGEFIARMDSDDISLPERFQKQIKVFMGWRDLEALGSGAILIDSEGNEIKRKQFPSNFKQIENILKSGVPVFDPSVMIRASFLKEIDGFDNRLAPADDYHLWLTLFKKKKIISNINDYLIKYRLHDTNLTVLQANEQLKKTFLALKIFNSEYSTNEFFDINQNIKYTYFQQLLIDHWNGSKTSVSASKKILKEYFSIKDYSSKQNNKIVLLSLKNLFIKKSFYFLIYSFLFIFSRTFK